MTVKEAMAILGGVSDKRIYMLIKSGKINAIRGEQTKPGIRPPLNITSTEDELRRAHAEIRTFKKGMAREQSTTSNGGRSQSDFYSMKQLGRMLGVSSDAARQRIHNRGFASKCIKVSGELAIPRRVAELLAKQGRLRSLPSKPTNTTEPKSPTVVALGNGLNTRMERIETALKDLSVKLDTLLKLWS